MTALDALTDGAMGTGIPSNFRGTVYATVRDAFELGKTTKRTGDRAALIELFDATTEANGWGVWDFKPRDLMVDAILASDVFAPGEAGCPAIGPSDQQCIGRATRHETHCDTVGTTWRDYAGKTRGLWSAS